MAKDTIINLPLVDQINDTGDDSWKERTCGICAVKMLMSFVNPLLESKPVMSLVKEGIGLDGYLENIGWKHGALVNLAREYDVETDFQKIFPKTKEEKEKNLKFIDKQIKLGQPVIASVFYGFNPQKGGHLIIVHGYKKSGSKIEGYFIQDPDHRPRGNNYFVTKDEFLKGWRGGLIWLK